MKYKIQNIIFPVPEICDEEKMYFRRKGQLAQVDKCIYFQKDAVCDFSTYFNSFSLNKWLHYTKLSNLHLAIRLQGDFIIKIYSAYWFRNSVAQECILSQHIQAVEQKEYTFEVDISRNDNVYFKIFSLSDSSIFFGGYYFTEINEDMLNPVNIDLVMCTFKREKYVTRNIRLIVNDFIKANSYNGSKHFRLKIVDNGKTLPVNQIKIPGLVEVYPNLNVGGSGGFCRGMIESLHDSFSNYILFMDDDVLVQIEAFEKTYNFLSLLKDKYKDAFLAGAMLRLDKKNMQHEALASFRETYLIGLKQYINLNKYKNVLFGEKMEKVKNIYGGWWFCCIPKTVANLENLPYPFFVRMDDIEYSLRNVKHEISLNGICVWHEAFDKKYSTLMENYFMLRNNLVSNLIHNMGSKKMNVEFFIRRFVHDIFRYDYGGAELLLDGLENILKGPEFFKQVDTVKDLQVHSQKQIKLIPFKDIEDQELLYRDFKEDLSKDQENIFTKIFRFITWNGHLLPNFFFKEHGYAEYGYGNNSKMYFRKKNLTACNQDFDAAVELFIQRKKAVSLTMRMLRLEIQFIIQYKKLKKAYQSEFKEMTSEKFWHEYLHL